MATFSLKQNRTEFCQFDSIGTWEPLITSKLILPEGLGVLPLLAGMPEETLVGEAPRAGVLAQHVDESVDMQARRMRPHAKHHARAEDPLRHVDLPIEPGFSIS